jgi:mannan endo-1,4-beta-mannosidase
LLWPPVPASAATRTVPCTINTAQERTPISPYIYGINQDLTTTEGWTARRMGGNRMTGYNWENNASHAGTDWYNYSDNLIPSSLGIPSGQANVPGIGVATFHDTSLARSCYSLITLPMAGYVSRDKSGEVTLAQTAPSARWSTVKPRKGAAFTLTPSLTDSFVYADEEVNFLVNRYGSASGQRGIKGYALDNEPALWPSTHPRIHPDTTRCGELITKSVNLATAVKAVDSTANIFGPVLYGFAAYLNLQDAPDWNTVKGSCRWFVDYYLGQMKSASTIAGRRLLDVLDIHWYSEANGNGERVVGAQDPANRANAEARMQAPRTLYDSTYTEDSWIGTWFSAYLPLVPELQKSINAYYPGTKLGITELNYGGEGHISGGIALADVLGALGRLGVYFVSYWQMETTTTYTTAAYKLYRNYNGSGAAYGITSVKAASANVPDGPIYAAVSGTNDSLLHILAINRNYDDSLRFTYTITNSRSYNSGRVWGFDQSSPTVREMTPIAGISGNTFSFTLPPLTVCHLVLAAQPTGIRSAAATRLQVPLFSVETHADRHAYTIRYAVPAGQTTTISICNTTGQEVAAFYHLTGVGVSTWDSSKLPNGVYFISLSGTMAPVYKMLILP